MRLLSPGGSKHHLFTYHEVRERLVQIYGDPSSDDDHKFIQNEVRVFRQAMPLYSLSTKFHWSIHYEN